MNFSRDELYGLIWSRPSFAQLEITKNCNQSCVFCFDGCSSGESYDDLSLDEWKRIIDKLRPLGVHTLHFSGGENFMFRGFAGLLKYAKQRGFFTHVNTNGTFSIKETLPYTDEYVFSVHGTREVHDAVTQNTGSFDRIEKNIGRANEYGVRADINSVLIRENAGCMAEMFRYFEDRFKIEKYSFTLAARSLIGKQFEQHELELDGDTYEWYTSLLDTAGRDRLTLKHGMYALYDYDIEAEPKSILYMPVCAAGKDKIIVKHDGSVYPCNYFQSDEYFCGNILTGDVFEIWNNGRGYRPFRKLILDDSIDPKCGGCSKKPKCFGGCRVWTKSFVERGEFSGERDFRCALGNAFAGDRDNVQVQP